MDRKEEGICLLNPGKKQEKRSIIIYNFIENDPNFFYEIKKISSYFKIFYHIELYIFSPISFFFKYNGALLARAQIKRRARVVETQQRLIFV